jgi:hypothetical protein
MSGLCSDHLSLHPSKMYPRSPSQDPILLPCQKVRRQGARGQGRRRRTPAGSTANRWTSENGRRNVFILTVLNANVRLYSYVFLCLNIHSLSQSTIGVVTFHAGLYSSLLSAAVLRCDHDYVQAKEEAKLLHEILKDMVSAVNLMLQVAQQFENIAIRMVAESSILSAATKKMKYLLHG